MCGIVGYIGSRNTLSVLIKGLKTLEYRGYDSAGISFIKDEQLHLIKKKGRVNELSDEVAEQDRRDRAADGVERRAELHELVALLALAAEGVQHRVHDEIQEAHRKARYERAADVHSEALDVAGEPLHSDAGESDRASQDRRELVALAL